MEIRNEVNICLTFFVRIFLHRQIIPYSVCFHDTKTSQRTSPRHQIQVCWIEDNPRLPLRQLHRSKLQVFQKTWLSKEGLEEGCMNMSFMLTTEQMRNKTKTVTRRLGWWNIKPGTILVAIEKGQGLKKGEKIKVIGQIRVISARLERLSDLLDSPYGFDEIKKEGFAGHPQLGWPHHFVTMFCAHNKCLPEKVVNRIEFEHI